MHKHIAIVIEAGTMNAHHFAPMSDASEPAPSLDLSDLRLMPRWVADFSKAQSSSASDIGSGDERPQSGHDRGDNRGRGERNFGDRNDRSRGPRPDSARGERKPSDKTFPPREGGRDFRGPPRGDRRDGPRGNFGRRDDRRPHFDAPAPVTGLSAIIEPEMKGVEAMAQMIRTAGKTYSVFDAARLVLTSGDRFHARLTLAPDSNAKFIIVSADHSVFLSHDEALAHLLQSDLLDHYYRVEEIELEEPKGNFISIAVCGMTGELLGPPNHHAYQTTLHKIHRERFSDMRFEEYKSRVRTDSTPETLEKWKESQKRGRQWVDIITQLPEGTEPACFKSRNEMEADFRKRHAEALVSEATEAVIAGNIPKNQLSPALYNSLRRAVDEARKHILSTAQQLCGSFEKLGLKVFKRRGGKLWVSRIRPRALETGVVLSDRIAKMLDLVKAKPGILVKDLIEAIAPSEIVSAENIVAPEAAPETPAPEKEAAPVRHQLSAEQLNALKDLHWLNSEGYVIEYADGVVFIGITEPPPARPKQVKQAPAAEASPATDKTEEAPAVAETVHEEPAVAAEEQGAEAS